MPQLAIILVNYKRAEDTIECIVSLRKSIFKDFETIVVDNASGDGSLGKLNKHCPDVYLICSEKNLGFAEGNNLGIRYALQRNCKYILLLNNDTVVNEHTLHVLVQTLEQHPQAGIVGAKIYSFDRPKVLWFAGGTFNIHSAMGAHIGIGEIDRGQYDELQPRDYITGCCLVARREVYETIGLLDSSYFAYLEDVDFCVRARHSGYSILYQPNAVVYHKVSSTSSWDSAVYLYFNLRNKILFLRKNSRRLKWLPYLPQLMYFYVRQFIRLFFKRRNMAAVHAAWCGLIDGLRNFTGEYGQGRLQKLLPK